RPTVIRECTPRRHTCRARKTQIGRASVQAKTRGQSFDNRKLSDKITMDALYPRYAAFIRSGDNVVLESGSSSFGVPPLTLRDDVQVHIQMLWGSIGWATGATFGIALADPKRKTILITGEGSHQLTANEIGNMGRYSANPI